MNVSLFSSLKSVLGANANEAKASIKLAVIDVLKSLGSDKYIVLLQNGKSAEVQSQTRLSEGSKYWAEFSQDKTQTPQIKVVQKHPDMQRNLSQVAFAFQEAKTILLEKNPQESLKQLFLEKLSNSATKEEFVANSNLLLSLYNQVATIPLEYRGYFSVLQFKKRYNRETKKSVLDFYASLEILGPISGLIWFENSNITIEIAVALQKTKQLLEENMDTLSYETTIKVLENITPLYEIKNNSLLDISI